jgi:hypothetical protein
VRHLRRAIAQQGAAAVLDDQRGEVHLSLIPAAMAPEKQPHLENREVAEAARGQFARRIWSDWSF